MKVSVSINLLTEQGSMNVSEETIIVHPWEEFTPDTTIQYVEGKVNYCTHSIGLTKKDNIEAIITIKINDSWFDELYTLTGAMCNFQLCDITSLAKKILKAREKDLRDYQWLLDTYENKNSYKRKDHRKFPKLSKGHKFPKFQ